MKKWILLVALLLAVLAALALGTIGMLNRDADSPPETADLVPERAEVADAENACTHFNAAAEALDWPESDTDEEKRIDAIIDGKQGDMKLAADLLARNRRALELIDLGLDCRICQPPEVTRISDLQPHTDTWRHLANLLEFKIACERQTGQYAKATKTCRDLLRFGDLIQRDAVDMVNWVVGISFLRTGQIAARQLANSPEVTDDDLAELAETLARIEPLDRGLIHALKAEYQIAASAVEDAQAEQKEQSTYGIHPNKTKQSLADFYRDQIENVPRLWAKVEMQTAEEVFRRHQDAVATAVGVNHIGKMLYDMFTDGTHLDYRCHNTCGLAATRLIVACKRYEKATGQLPPTLDALVPQYLDAVPVDPFDGKPFRYVRDKRIVYAVGTDLIDAGGSVTSTTGEPIRDDWEHLSQAEDAVSHIDGWTVSDQPE